MTPILYTPHELQCHELIITVFSHLTASIRYFISTRQYLSVPFYHHIFIEGYCIHSLSVTCISSSPIHIIASLFPKYFVIVLYYGQRETLPRAFAIACVFVAAIMIALIILDGTYLRSQAILSNDPTVCGQPNYRERILC